ncbi:MAG: hypothetical protein GY703_13910 [Gammaproteobacteria bacterium]|nr:hypothetical protein [Gammaproteobacteria bacterium]
MGFHTLRLLIGVLTLTSPAAHAQGFPIELTTELHDLDVVVTPRVSTSRNVNIGTIIVNNTSNSAISCNAVFRSGPELPARRSVDLAEGEKGTMMFRARRRVLRMTVELECIPNPGNKGSGNK